MKNFYQQNVEPTLTYFGVYSQSFREQIHLLIAWGYDDAKKKIRTDNELEPAITGFIAAAINDRFRSINCPSWCNYYAVKDDPPVEKEGTSGRSRPRVDIIIEAPAFKGRPEFMFEAKRLRRKGYGVGKYVGSDGMGCFIRGLYGVRYDEVAMLGYVQSDSLEYWQNEVKSVIEKDAIKLNLNPPQHDVKIVENFVHEWISKHERKIIGRSVIIYHILLDCTI